MDRVNMTSTKVPVFNGKDYNFWKRRMQVCLESLGVDVWGSVKYGYTSYLDADGYVPTPEEKRKAEANSKAKNAIISGLLDSDLVKVDGCETAKEMWLKLQGIYEGDMKVKEAKLQIYRAKFENLKMKDDESVDSYMQRMNETVTSIRGLGESIDDSIVVKKILRSMPTKFDAKISAIEEAQDLNRFSLDQLHGSLIAYEMRNSKENSADKQVAFRSKAKKNDSDESDDEVEEVLNFVKRLERGKGKFRGKLPLKCFTCGGGGGWTFFC